MTQSGDRPMVVGAVPSLKSWNTDPSSAHSSRRAPLRTMVLSSGTGQRRVAVLSVARTLAVAPLASSNRCWMTTSGSSMRGARSTGFGVSSPGSWLAVATVVWAGAPAGGARGGRDCRIVADAGSGAIASGCTTGGSGAIASGCTTGGFGVTTASGVGSSSSSRERNASTKRSVRLSAAASSLPRSSSCFPDASSCCWNCFSSNSCSSWRNWSSSVSNRAARSPCSHFCWSSLRRAYSRRACSLRGRAFRLRFSSRAS